MQSSIAFFKAKMQIYNSKLNISKESIKISSRKIFSINSDSCKNITTRSPSKCQSSEGEEDRQISAQSFTCKDILERIRMKPQIEIFDKNSTKIIPKRHKSFSTYLNKMIGQRKNQKELTVYKSLSKNIKEMKVEKCKTQIVFHKNLRPHNNTQQLRKPIHRSSHKKTLNFPDFKGNLIILGMKQKKVASLKAEQKLMSQSMCMPHIISAWNSKSSPPKKFNTVIMEKTSKNQWTGHTIEKNHNNDQELIQFLKSSKFSLKKRPSFLAKKLSKSLIS